MPLTKNQNVLKWVEEITSLTQPDYVVWIDGSEEQLNLLRKEDKKELKKDQLSDYTAEERIFICTANKEDAGPLNNWCDPEEMYAKLRPLYSGIMKGRTMYIIPYLMGPIGSPFAKVGIEITDFKCAVLNMADITLVGKQVFENIDDVSDDFVRCLNSKTDINPEKKYICHFPEDNTIWSLNSTYDGKNLLDKKCFALRMASCQAKNEGWMAENMLILGVEKPDGEVKYITSAFPSECGKTNFAMLIPPDGYLGEGYRIFPVSDDIAWIRKGQDGRMYAVNPENCFCISNNSDGVPISAIIFGGRRSRTTPLVYQSFSWNHGTFVGSAVSYEAAVTSVTVGGLRHDPMAMKSFCGYNMADYFGHWIHMGELLGDKAPEIFNVNWFRTDENGEFLWPGYGNNMRVLDWIIKRCEGTADAEKTPVGYIPKLDDINIEGIENEVTPEVLAKLLEVDKNLWKNEVEDLRAFYKQFGNRLPKEIIFELNELEKRLNNK